MNEREIFQSAIDISDANDRQSYLDSACGADAALREQVEKLLRAHDNASRFLETPAAEQLTPGTVDAADATALLPKFMSAPHANPTEDAVSLEFLEPGTKPGSLGRLAHYEVLEILGRGAFGIVLKAFDEKLHRMVAIKVMTPELAATSPPRKRFLREAQSSAKVRHENIVSIYAVEEHPVPYLVMEYIPGGTLQQRLDQHGPLDLDEILRLGQQIALGLAAAHAQGLIHRDIKPANILIESGVDERVKITDFGLARATDDASLTQSGLIAGTPMYMAPEQAKGQPLDHRADLFSLGSVLYTMASGRPPFRAPNTIAVLKRLCEDTPRPITEVIPETPQWLCDIITKLHAKDPDDRFQSAKEVADVLGQHLAFLREPTRAPRPAAIAIPVESETVVTPNVRRPAKAGGWSPTAVLLAIIVGMLSIPLVCIVMVWIGLAIPAYQAARMRNVPVSTTTEIREPLQAVVETKGNDNSSHGLPADTDQQRLKTSSTTVIANAPDFTRQREVADWALQNGGMVTVEWIDPPQQGETFRPGMVLPDRTFVVRNLLMNGPNTKMTAYDMDQLVAARHLFDLGLTLADQEAARRLTQFPGLYSLNVGYSQWNPFSLPPLPRLVELGVMSETIDDQFAFLRNLPELRYLTLNTNNAKTLPDLTSLDAFQQLRLIRVNDGTIPEGVVAHLQQHNPRLRIFTQTGTTLKLLGHDPAVEVIQRLMELGAEVRALRLDDGSVPEQLLTADLAKTNVPWRITDVRFYRGHPASVNDLRELTAFAGTLGYVTLDQQSNGDRLAAALAELKYLMGISILESDLTDTGLTTLQTFDKLHYLGVAGNPKVTRAAIEAFHRAVPGCRIVSDFGEMTPDFALISDITLPQPPWQSLFNGKDLTGWKPHPEEPGNWRVEEGVLTGSGTPGYLFSERDDFTDFHLRADVQINAGGDSGIMLRSPFVRPSQEGLPGYEAQIQAGKTLIDGWASGAIGSSFPPNGWRLLVPTAARPNPDERFLMEVLAKGNEIETRINGEKVAWYIDPDRRFTRGHIVLQQSGADTKVQFYKIEVRPLSP